MRLSFALIVSCVTACLANVAYAQTEYQFKVLYVIGIGEGYTSFSTNNIVGEGGTVGGWGVGTATSGRYQAMLWSPEHPNGLNLSRSSYRYSVTHRTTSAQQFGYATLHSAPSATRATLWYGTAQSAVDLHPEGYVRSQLNGSTPSVQAGIASGGDGIWRAMMWRGSRDSATELHSGAFVSTVANETDGQQQVGTGYPTNGADIKRALLWSGTASSIVNLHPPNYNSSEAVAVANGVQVGYAGNSALRWEGSAESGTVIAQGRANAISPDGSVIVGDTRSTMAHAWVWTAAEYTDLHALLPPECSMSRATFVAGDGTIYGTAIKGDTTHVVAWVVPEPASLSCAFAVGLMFFRRHRG